MSSMDNDEKQWRNAIKEKSDNIEIIISDTPEEVIKEPVEQLRSRCQISLETMIKGSDFIFDSVDLLHYSCH